jgi:peptide-methionine (S)-S-oxide reductase
MASLGRNKTQLISAEEALPGHSEAMPLSGRHAVHPERTIVPPLPEGTASAVFGMGCFWGAERLFWQTPGVYSTAVGYAGGYTENPSYAEVCSGRTGHAEAVLVVYDPARIGYADLLKLFWEGHDPTQGLRQGNDVGSQYRSAIYYAGEEQKAAAEASRESYAAALREAGRGEITTEIDALPAFYYAEEYHQQYLSDAKNPFGYCGLGSTGVACPVGTGVTQA